MKGGEIAVRTLASLGVDTIFGMPGGAILPLYDYFKKYRSVRHILIRHEQAGSFAADGYARVTGKVGVCMATSGPGATNLITGIAGAMMDSVPLLAITAQVHSEAVGSDAFQEVDSIGVTIPVVKHSFFVQRPEDIADALVTAHYIAGSGRPGPVHVDITKDALAGAARWRKGKVLPLPGYRIPRVQKSAVRAANRKLADMLSQPDIRPVLIVGHGVEISGAEQEVVLWAERMGIPVVNTLLGTGSFPNGHSQWLGPVGMHGTAVANKAVSGSNVIIGMGMRFDDRVTGDLVSFTKGKSFVHFEIDPSEIGKNVDPDIVFLGDIKEVLQILLKEKERQYQWNEWWNTIRQWQEKYPPFSLPRKQKRTGAISSAWAIDTLFQITQGKDIVVSDVGRHQMWLMRYYRFRRSRSHVSHGGLGSMGFGFPAALGAKIGVPRRTVWAVCGDGSFQMNMQELATAAENNIDVNILVFNDGSLGMVRQWQELFYRNNRAASVFAGNPDFAALAGAFGVPGKKVKKPSDLEPALRWAQKKKGPCLVEIAVDPNEHVYPMVPAGKGLHQQIITDPRIK